MEGECRTASLLVTFATTIPPYGMSFARRAKTASPKSKLRSILCLTSQPTNQFFAQTRPFVIIGGNRRGDLLWQSRVRADDICWASTTRQADGRRDQRLL